MNGKPEITALMPRLRIVGFETPLTPEIKANITSKLRKLEKIIPSHAMHDPYFDFNWGIGEDSEAYLHDLDLIEKPEETGDNPRFMNSYLKINRIHLEAYCAFANKLTMRGIYAPGTISWPVQRQAEHAAIIRLEKRLAPAEPTLELLNVMRKKVALLRDAGFDDTELNPELGKPKNWGTTPEVKAYYAGERVLNLRDDRIPAKLFKKIVQFVDCRQ